MYAAARRQYLQYVSQLHTLRPKPKHFASSVHQRKYSKKLRNYTGIIQKTNPNCKTVDLYRAQEDEDELGRHF